MSTGVAQDNIGRSVAGQAHSSGTGSWVQAASHGQGGYERA